MNNIEYVQDLLDRAEQYRKGRLQKYEFKSYLTPEEKEENAKVDLIKIFTKIFSMNINEKNKNKPYTE